MNAKHITFVYEYKLVKARVEKKLAQYAVRKTDKDGNSLFEALVFDDENKDLFTEYFREAGSLFKMKAAAYLRYYPDFSTYREDESYHPEDFTCTLLMPLHYNHNFTDMVNDEGMKLFVNYICYRWLEDKDPDGASIYLQGVETSANNIQTCLNKTYKFPDRPISWY